MKKRKMRLEEKFIFVVFLVALFCFGLLGILSYHKIGRMMVEQRKSGAMGMAQVVASEIDGDAYDKIASPEDPAFVQIYNSLSKYTLDPNISYVYTMRELDGRAYFVVDVDKQEPANYMEEYEMLPDMKLAFEGHVSCDQRQNADKWGAFCSAYAPIYDSKHRVVGIVGCDIHVDFINDLLRQLRLMIVFLVTVFAVVAVVSYMGLSGQLMGKDFITEVANYDSLMKYGKKKEKQGKLADYVGILLDIKDFKYLNQQTKSNIADEILREYAMTIRKLLKRKEFIASTGSDNFYVLMKKGRESDFLDALKDLGIRVWDRDVQRNLVVHSRCGIYPIEQGDTIKRAIDNSSLAMTAAKKTQTMDVMYFEQSMLDAMIKEKDILKSFRLGLTKGEFQVYYQPKVDLEYNCLCGAEALVRWFRDGKMIAPNEFIPVLESNDEIVELDFYVFEQVCKDIQRWKEMGIPLVKISSNFSKLHLKNNDFSSRILALLLRYDVDPKLVEIELTESSGYQDFEALTKFVDCMNAANVSTSIDDFGTGYSSLSMLRDLNVDVIKLDRSFFRNVDSEDTADKKMVENVIHMIQDLDREIICEGIETKQQAEFLKQVQSPIVQGFLFDKPLDREAFEKRMKKPVYDKK